MYIPSKLDDVMNLDVDLDYLPLPKLTRNKPRLGTWDGRGTKISMNIRNKSTFFFHHPNELGYIVLLTRKCKFHGFDF